MKTITTKLFSKIPLDKVDHNRAVENFKQPEKFTPENKIESKIDGIFFNVVVVENGCCAGIDSMYFEIFHAASNRRLYDLTLKPLSDRSGAQIKKLILRIETELALLDWTVSEEKIRSSQPHIDLIKYIVFSI